MYINDVVRSVRRLYPSEYDAGEIYMWCNEVSSMLAAEDRNVYKTVELPVSEDGSFLLPENVDMENIEYITAGRTVLSKRDLREYGGRKIYVKDLNGIFLKNGVRLPSSVKVDYLAPYEPVRLAKYRGGISINKDEGEFTINSCEFIPGDILVIRLGVKDGSVSQSFENVPLLSVRFEDGDAYSYICTVPEDTFKTAEKTADENALITRVVTERTVCAPPFDSMYIDYVMAKINLYQHDTDGFNTYMTQFNSRLSAYKNWLIKRMPKGEGRLINWW